MLERRSIELLEYIADMKEKERAKDLNAIESQKLDIEFQDAYGVDEELYEL